MDDVLPSYESAITQNPWELIVRYLPSDDLCSAALVCQQWHAIFTPQLWGNPASHFGDQNDTVYVALTRFKRTLRWSRAWVRELTHTLHLPPAHAEIYGGPHYEWLRDCLERLPRLQSLIVSGLPFFDHASLLTLRHSSAWWQTTHANIYPAFGLRLLDASHCSNVTPHGLAEALPHFPDLVSLDLSRTSAAKDEIVLSKLKVLWNLRVLRLRGLGLKDSDLSIVAPAISVRVRSLDLSDNQLTDVSARLLLDYCLKEATVESHHTRSPLPPVRYSRPEGESDAFVAENLDAHLRTKLTRGFIGRLAVEEASDVGVTHLYLSNNTMTVEGISGLIRSAKLQVLDVGTLPTKFRTPLLPYVGNKTDLALPCVQKLTPMLSEYAAARLVHLRINHAVVTEDCPIETVPSPRAELNGNLEAYRPEDARELPASESPQPELDSLSTAVHELAGDETQPTELSSTSDTTSCNRTTLQGESMDGTATPIIEVTTEVPEINRGPAYAPEPVQLPGPPLAPLNLLADATGGLPPISRSFGGREEISPSSESSKIVTRSRKNSIQHVEGKRARLDLRQSQENRLHPGMLPNLHTLVLTDVPSKTSNEETVNRLVQFIKDCAEEDAIARLRATHTYMLPPGRARHIAEREYARSLFALRRIVLEVAPPKAAPKKITTSWRTYPTKSSTEDADSEAFWEAAAYDFSFFGDEECGLPNTEPGRGPPLAAMSGLILAPKPPAPPPRPRQPDPQPMPVVDVVAAVGKFRREKKAEYHAALQNGQLDPYVEGYWPGDITIVRKPLDPDSGNLDFYGNKFESGWLYR